MSICVCHTFHVTASSTESLRKIFRRINCNRDFYLINYLKSHRATLPDEYRLPSESY